MHILNPYTYRIITKICTLAQNVSTGFRQIFTVIGPLQVGFWRFPVLHLGYTWATPGLHMGDTWVTPGLPCVTPVSHLTGCYTCVTPVLLV